jgi:hypothetical protein
MPFPKATRGQDPRGSNKGEIPMDSGEAKRYDAGAVSDSREYRYRVERGRQGNGISKATVWT